MNITPSLLGKSIQVVASLAKARSAYEKVLRPFSNVGAYIGYHESPKAFLAFLDATRPVVPPDLLIVSHWFDADMQGEEFIDIMRLRGYVGMSYIGSGIAYMIQAGTMDLQRLVRSVLTDHPEEASLKLAVKG